MLMNRCKNCKSENIKVIQTTHNYDLIKCNDCLFYFKNNKEIDYSSLNEDSFSAYNFNRKKEVKELDLVIKKHCNKNCINVLEIGSGTGVISNELIILGYKVVAVEPSIIAVQMSKKTFPHINVINDYFNSNLVAKNIDVILMCDVMEHLEPNNKVFEEICNFMKNETLFIIKSGNPSSFNAKLFLTRWIYILSPQHISFYSHKALKIFCKNRNLELVNYYKFKHAYGGLALDKILKNILKLMFKVLHVDALLKRNFGLVLANDHFIAVIKKVSF